MEELISRKVVTEIVTDLIRTKEDFPSIADWHKWGAEEILTSYHASVDLAAKTTSSARQAVAEAIRCGLLLLAKREEIGNRKQWSRWFATFIPDMHVRKIQRWMQLAASTTHMSLNESESLLKRAKSCRQAYLYTGILPEDKPTVSEKDPTSFFDLLIKLISSKQLQSFQQDDLSDWSEEHLKALFDVLTLLNEQRVRIAGALGIRTSSNNL